MGFVRGERYVEYHVSQELGKFLPNGDIIIGVLYARALLEVVSNVLINTRNPSQDHTRYIEVVSK